MNRWEIFKSKIVNMHQPTSLSQTVFALDPVTNYINTFTIVNYGDSNISQHNKIPMQRVLKDARTLSITIRIPINCEC